MTKQRIELSTPDLRPMNFALYRVGPRARDFEKTKIDRKLGMDVIEPAELGRA